MSKELRIAVIGCGSRGSDAAAAIKDAKGVELAGFVDTSEPAARSLGERYGIPWVTEIAALAGHASFDAVYIASPHSFHAGQAIESASLGKHIVVEKPMAHDLASAQKMVAAAKSAGVALVPWLGFRYLPQIVKAAHLIDQGVLGRLLGATVAHHLSKPPTYYSRQGIPTWQSRQETAGGGVLITQAVHYLDWLLYLGRERVTEVSARYATLESEAEVEDSLVMWLRFENGGLATLNASTCVLGLYRTDQVQNEFRLWGTDGHLSLTPPSQYFSSRAVDGKHPERWHDLAPLPRMKAPAIELLERAAQAIKTDQDPPITSADGLRVQAVVEAAYRSGRESRPVPLAELWWP